MVLGLILLSMGILLPVIVWLYTHFTCGVCRSRRRMDGKTVIVTGANSGIGKATALDLARRGARVIMACRNLEKAKIVKDNIVHATKNKNVVVMKLDLSLLTSVRKFAEEINRKEERLDVLIHNAGICIPGGNVTEEGLDLTWATNYFGPFLLTHLLIDLLRKTGHSRIVTVSSVFHLMGSVNPENPNPVEETLRVKLYSSTKFAGVLFSTELARRLEGTGVTANSLHPGVIKTPIWESTPLWTRIVCDIFTYLFKTEEQGAQTTVYLAVSEEVDQVSGKYFADCKADCFPWSVPAQKTKDKSIAKRFWEASEEVVQLKPSDPHILLESEATST